MPTCSRCKVVSVKPNGYYCNKCRREYRKEKKLKPEYQARDQLKKLLKEKQRINEILEPILNRQKEIEPLISELTIKVEQFDRLKTKT